ncbi:MULTISPECIES: copper-binding protein [Microvirga]|uniref:Copper-binding protein n=2 Tax=Microvirga TaxID=186650 RepID=A0ABV6Y9Y4_9HYPH|nr:MULTISPECIES: copper-binding protein [Microvirga]
MSSLILLPRTRGPALKALVLGGLTAAALALPAHAQSSSGGSMGNMQNMPGMGSGNTTAATSAMATGTVASVNTEQRKVKLNHEPIPAIGWPAMSMEFAAAPSVDLTQVKPGAKVKFTLNKGTDGSYTVQSLSPAQ